MTGDPRIAALPDIHGHAKGEHKPFAEERPIPYTARMLFLWFFHACRRGAPRFLMVADHVNYLTFEDPAAVNLVRRALKLAQAGDLYGAAEAAGVEVGHAAVVSEGLRRGMRFSIGAEVDNDPRNRPDVQNIVDAMRPDGIVRSIHFLTIEHPQHGEWQWPFDNPEFKDLYDVVGTERTWELYVEALLDAIDKLPGNIVGHFYVPGKFGHWPDDAKLEEYEDRLLAACLERGMAVEINSRYLYKFYVDDGGQLERFRTLHERLLRKAKALGVMVAVGSDAHSPKDQGRAFVEVLEMLDRAEINEIAFPIAGRLAHVALRATDDTVAASAPAASGAAEPAERIAGQERSEPPPEVAAPAEVAAAETAVAATAKRKRPSRSKAALAAAAAARGDAAAAAVAEPESAVPASNGASNGVRPSDHAASPDEASKDETAAPIAALNPEPEPEPGVASAASAAVDGGDARPSAEEAPLAARVTARDDDATPVVVATPPRRPASTPSASTKPSSSRRETAAPARTPAKAVPSKGAQSKGAPRKGSQAKSSSKGTPAKPTAKKSVASKSAAPKSPKKPASSSKSAPSKPAVKKASAKAAPAKKAAAKKTVAKKAVAKKPAVAKKTSASGKAASKGAKRPSAAKSAKKSGAASAKKTVAKKSTKKPRR